MLKKITLKDWKSYEHAELHLDPFTIIIGANASGKSNVVDALVLLSRLTRGMDVLTALEGSDHMGSLRGGAQWAARVPTSKFSISATIQANDVTEIEYEIGIDVSEKPKIISEKIVRTRFQKTTKLSPDKRILLEENLHDSNEKNAWGSGRTILGFEGAFRYEINSTLLDLPKYNEELEGVNLAYERSLAGEYICSDFRNVFLLEPVPSEMRSYAFKGSDMKENGANIAGVIEAMGPNIRKELLGELTKYARQLPEHEIVKVESELVGKLQKDAMLFCIEKWGENEVTIDARGMSDGTLRFLAIAAALLTRPEGSCLIIEEIDNGLHPSRAIDLIKMIEKIGSERKLDVIITTHNPALLNEFIPKYIPFITIAHRDKASGSSKLILLENVPHLSRLLSRGKLGDISMDGSLLKALSKMEL